MYKVNGTEYQRYFEAIAAAKAIGADVIETANGGRRWTPAAPVSAKKQRIYQERKSAHAAQAHAK